MLQRHTVATNVPATLTCAITDIDQTATVTWSLGTDASLDGVAGYTDDQGIVTNTAQTSKLTITSSRLQTLGDTSVFTCSVKSGEFPDSPETKRTLTLTALTYCKFYLYPTIYSRCIILNDILFIL